MDLHFLFTTSTVHEELPTERLYRMTDVGYGLIVLADTNII